MSKKHRKNSARHKPQTGDKARNSAPKKPATTGKTAPQPPKPDKAAAKKCFPRKTIILAAAMLVCAAAGTWLAVSPALDKGKQREHRDDLLASIERGGGEIELDEAFAATGVDFYEGGEADVPADASEPAEPVETVVTGLGVLAIDRINAKLPVADGVSSAQLKVAVGHVRGTPEIGGAGNSVIAGHRSYTYGEFFNRLDELVVGDVIRYKSIGGEEMEFNVSEILTVLPDDPAALEQPEDKSVITLLTCTPVHTATHRLLVRAERIK